MGFVACVCVRAFSTGQKDARKGRREKGGNEEGQMESKKEGTKQECEREGRWGSIFCVRAEGKRRKEGRKEGRKMEERWKADKNHIKARRK